MRPSVSRERVELRQPSANLLLGPVLLAVILLAAGSMLSIRTAANGPVGFDYTGYALKLRDNATGKEVYAGAFGRQKVQQACESQGWSFS
jgi:hypothetical protein